MKETHGIAPLNQDYLLLRANLVSSLDLITLKIKMNLEKLKQLRVHTAIGTKFRCGKINAWRASVKHNRQKQSTVVRTGTNICLLNQPTKHLWDSVIPFF